MSSSIMCAGRFLIMTEDGLYKNTRIKSAEEMCRKYQFKDLLFARPSAISVSDEGLFLVGFDSGALAYGFRG